MNPRGPRRSINQPSSGCTQVWKRMNSVNANWISESFQPVAFCSGGTKSVHAYCRFAIMIIAMSDAPSWHHRLLMLINHSEGLRPSDSPYTLSREPLRRLAPLRVARFAALARALPHRARRAAEPLSARARLARRVLASLRPLG